MSFYIRKKKKSYPCKVLSMHILGQNSWVLWKGTGRGGGGKPLIQLVVQYENNLGSVLPLQTLLVS